MPKLTRILLLFILVASGALVGNTFLSTSVNVRSPGDDSLSAKHRTSTSSKVNRGEIEGKNAHKKSDSPATAELDESGGEFVPRSYRTSCSTRFVSVSDPGHTTVQSLTQAGASIEASECELHSVFDHTYDSLDLESLAALAASDPEAAYILAERLYESNDADQYDEAQQYITHAFVLSADSRVYQRMLEHMRLSRFSWKNNQLDINNSRSFYVMTAAAVKLGIAPERELDDYATQLLRYGVRLNRDELDRSAREIASGFDRQRIAAGLPGLAGGV